MPSKLDELRILIMKQPHVFGLRADYVNPLLLYQTKLVTEPDSDSNDFILECFQFCKTNVERKHYELTHPDPNLEDQEPELVEHNSSKPTNGNGKTKSKFSPKTNSNSTGITPKQLRYLGYLWRQLGEEPNYDDIGKLSQTQATMRIKTLEDKLGLTN